MSNIPPVQLFLGVGDPVETALTHWACDIVQVAKTSREAEKIAARQHRSLRLLVPTKGNYKRADFESLFDQAYRVRHANDPLLFIIYNAEALNAACANSLLKLLEEPPAAVFFALVAAMRESVLPTVASRAVVVQCTAETGAIEKMPLFQLFLAPERATPVDFVKAYGETTLDDTLSSMVLDALYTTWQKRYETAVGAGNEPAMRQADRVLRVFSAAIDRPPMPGSLVLFWRTLFVMVSS